MVCLQSLGGQWSQTCKTVTVCGPKELLQKFANRLALIHIILVSTTAIYTKKEDPKVTEGIQNYCGDEKYLRVFHRRNMGVEFRST